MISPFGRSKRKASPSPESSDPSWEELLGPESKKPVTLPEFIDFTPAEPAPIGLGFPNKDVTAVPELSNGLAETEARIAKEATAKVTRQEYLLKKAEELAEFRRKQLTSDMAQDAARLRALRDGLDVEGIEAGV